MPDRTPIQPSADRNLLFGILALQMDFIDRDALIAAMQAWVFDKTKSLGRVLQEQGALSGEQRALLDALVQEHLRLHHNDPEQSLAAVSSIKSVRQDLEQIGDADLHASLAIVASAPAGSPASTIDDVKQAGLRYRILRPHAKGGLGEVYVAEDQELHREVALKEIQPEHAHNPQSRGRFLLEAEITGGLEHPGIVPVYGLGQYADGRPFYAMRFIKGDNLKEAIRRFHEADRPDRDPGERSLALRQLLRRFIDVCNAVAYAHSRGVLHRDLKPGNIMLGKYGETLLVDWGLAKARGERPGARGETDETTLRPSYDSGVAATLMGTAIGTPAYMSPEQASGQLDLLGPASDVYSLGATLYALLTGQAPFPERDKAAVLDKVRSGDFPRPRQVKPAVPPALDAVCLKAMALRPEDRYATALALAADVEHWLADEPVSAYGEPWPVRAGRWMRRHRPVLAAAGALLLTAVVALAISTVLIRQREQAAQTARQQAEQQRDRADGNLRLARDAVDKTVTKITEDPRLKETDFNKLRHDLLQSMVPFYEKFVEQREHDPDLEAERGRAYRRLASIRKEIGDRARAVEDCQQMQMIFAQLAAHFPTVPGYRQELAGSHNNLGILLHDLGKRVEAEAAYRDALKIQEELAADFPTVPGYRRELAISHNNLGALLRDLGKRGEVEAAYRDALRIQVQLAADFPTVPGYRRELAISHNNLGALLRDLGKRGEAEAAFRDALKIREQLAADFPTVPQYRLELGASHYSLGLLLRDLGKRGEAEAAYRDALKIQAQLAVDFPTVPQYRLDLARSHHNLGVLQDDLGKRVEAEAAYRDALKIQALLAADFPTVPRYRQELARSHNNLGLLLRDLGKRGEAEAACRDALKIRAQLAADFPTVPQYRQELAGSHHSLGVLHYDLGKRGEAEAAYRDALKIQAQLAADFPTVPQYRQDLARSRNNLGALLRDLGKRIEAEAAYRDALKIKAQLAADFPTVPQYRLDLAQSHINLGRLLHDLGKRGEAEAAYRDALKIQAQLAADFPTVPQYREGLALSHNNLGILLKDLGKRGEAEAAYRDALRIREQLAADFPAVPDYQNDLAGTLGNLALLARDQTEFAQARQLFEEAVPHHQAALKANPQHRTYRQYFLYNRLELAPTLAGLGEHAAAAAVAEELARLNWDPAGDCYNAACALSQCAPLAEKDSKLAAAERPKQARAYADRALELLRQAVAKGYKDGEHMKKDKELDPLREREDFKKLVNELEKQQRAGTTPDKENDK